MADMAMRSGAHRVAVYAPRLGFWLLVISLVLLALAPLGWRFGIWHFRTAFSTAMRYSAFAAAAAAVVSLIALFWWGAMTQAGRAMAVIGVIGGAFLVYWPLHFYAMLYPLPLVNNTPLPFIHDITTDPENPPTFSAAQLQAREAEKGNPVAIDPEVIKQQKAAYSDIAPLKTALPPAEAFKRALATAQGMSGWTVTASDPASGRIEAKQSSMFFGFTDDVVIRVAADGSGSRIDMRSESRQGRSDFGVNAARVRRYMAALKPNLG